MVYLRLNMGKHDNASDPDLSVFTNGQFWSPTCGALSLEGVIDEIKNFINEDNEASYRVIIGSDSQAKRINGEAEIDFVSAIVAHRLGRGGRYFWHKTRQRKKYVLRDKI